MRRCSCSSLSAMRARPRASRKMRCIGVGKCRRPLFVTASVMIALLISAPATLASKDPVQSPVGVTVSFPKDNRVVFEYNRAGSISTIAIDLATIVYIVPADICAKLGTVRMETVRLSGPAIAWPQAAPQRFFVRFMGTERHAPNLFLEVLLAFRNGQFSDALVTGPTGETTTWYSSSR